PSCCCPCLHPSPVPNLPGCVYHWFHLCPVNSPCLVHLCLCLPRLDCSHLSLVICCHVPSCCCSCLPPSPAHHHPVWLCYWFLLCPVNSPCLVSLSHCLPRLDCSHLSLVICCLCVYIVLVFWFLVASS